MGSYLNPPTFHSLPHGWVRIEGDYLVGPFAARQDELASKYQTETIMDDVKIPLHFVQWRNIAADVAAILIADPTEGRNRLLIQRGDGEPTEENLDHRHIEWLRGRRRHDFFNMPTSLIEAREQLNSHAADVETYLGATA